MIVLARRASEGRFRLQNPSLARRANNADVARQTWTALTPNRIDCHAVKAAVTTDC
jgi:hypothetical protein